MKLSYYYPNKFIPFTFCWWGRWVGFRLVSYESTAKGRWVFDWVLYLGFFEIQKWRIAK